MPHFTKQSFGRYGLDAHNTEPIVRVDGLSKTYGRVHALETLWLGASTLVRASDDQLHYSFASLWRR